MKNILITGGAGFIGSNFCNFLYKNTHYNLYIIDKLSYASQGLDRLRLYEDFIKHNRVKIFTFDLVKPLTHGILQELGNNIHYIFHFCAETHVDTSIKDPIETITNNINSTLNILEFARSCKNLEKFFNISTDEVYGSIHTGSFTEKSKHSPTNPYAASKSASENFCTSYSNTYKIPIITVNLTNVFGEFQHIEKFIPKCIHHILNNKTVKIHTNKELVPGSRFYIHVNDVSNALYFLLFNGENETYNISGLEEINNLHVAQVISRILNKPLKYELVSYDIDRPYHDVRYAIDSTKLSLLGWSPTMSFDDNIEDVVNWYIKRYSM